MEPLTPESLRARWIVAHKVLVAKGKKKEWEEDDYTNGLDDTRRYNVRNNRMAALKRLAEGFLRDNPSLAAAK